jgi:hypothetical protein
VGRFKPVETIGKVNLASTTHLATLVLGVICDAEVHESKV